MPGLLRSLLQCLYSFSINVESNSSRMPEAIRRKIIPWLFVVECAPFSWTGQPLPFSLGAFAIRFQLGSMPVDSISGNSAKSAETLRKCFPIPYEEKTRNGILSTLSG